MTSLPRLSLTCCLPWSPCSVHLLLIWVWLFVTQSYFWSLQVWLFITQPYLNLKLPLWGEISLTYPIPSAMHCLPFTCPGNWCILAAVGWGPRKNRGLFTAKVITHLLLVSESTLCSSATHLTCHFNFLAPAQFAMDCHKTCYMDSCEC